MINIIECTKKFHKLSAVDRLTVSIDEGVTVLLGPNGAGKTTLIRCICGLYRLDSGRIEKLKDKIGFLPQEFGMFNRLTLFHMMEYFATLKGIESKHIRSSIEECIEQVNLTERLYSRVSELSGGMIRRAGIAQAILGNPDIVLLDEPATGLDPEERVRFKNLLTYLRDQNKAIVISTHIVSDVDTVCDQVIIMNDGHLVVKGNPKEIEKYAQGKVYCVNKIHESKLCGNFLISGNIEESGEIMLRVLSNNLQQGHLLNPTLEDGYLCAIKNI